MVTAERGDAAAGQQFSTVTVAARRTCRLPGTPAVHTVDAGGTPLRTAVASKPTAPAVVVKAGHRVTAVVHGPTTCNATVSPYLVVTPAPGAGATRASVPLRACTLAVDPYRS